MNEQIIWAIKTDMFGTVLRRKGEFGEVVWVPEAAGNRHYEEYLEWVAAGNEPEVIEG